MRTIVLGASPNPKRYAYRAVAALSAKGHEVFPLGIRKGKTAAGFSIINDRPSLKDIHTVTLYLSPDIQKNYYDYIINNIQPQRIIFNPGTENPQFIQKIKQSAHPIEIEIACTLVLLSIGNY